MIRENLTVWAWFFGVTWMAVGSRPWHGIFETIMRWRVIRCDAGPGVVRAYPVLPDGAGYKAQITDILTTDDKWFRPADVCVAPDGAIYVADWNDAGVGGHNMADQSLEKMTGRVYRVSP